MADIQVSKRLFTAANWATELHAARGAQSPSVAQVLGVASLVLGEPRSCVRVAAMVSAIASRAPSLSAPICRNPWTSPA